MNKKSSIFLVFFLLILLVGGFYYYQYHVNKTNIVNTDINEFNRIGLKNPEKFTINLYSTKTKKLSTMPETFGMDVDIEMIDIKDSTFTGKTNEELEEWVAERINGRGPVKTYLSGDMIVVINDGVFKDTVINDKNNNDNERMDVYYPDYWVTDKQKRLYKENLQKMMGGIYVEKGIDKSTNLIVESAISLANLDSFEYAIQEIPFANWQGISHAKAYLVGGGQGGLGPFIRIYALKQNPTTNQRNLILITKELQTPNKSANPFTELDSEMQKQYPEVSQIYDNCLSDAKINLLDVSKPEYDNNAENKEPGVDEFENSYCILKSIYSTPENKALLEKTVNELTQKFEFK